MISFSGFTQVTDDIKEQIEIKAYQIDTNLGTLTFKKRFELDSLIIKAKLFDQKISSEIKFQESGNLIKVDIYLDDDKIMLIRATEQSATLKSYDDAKKISMIYFENGVKIDEKVRIAIPGELHGIAMPKKSDLDKEFGYNKNLTTEYLHKLSYRISDKIAE